MAGTSKSTCTRGSDTVLYAALLRSSTLEEQTGSNNRIPAHEDPAVVEPAKQLHNSRCHFYQDLSSEAVNRWLMTTEAER